MYKLKYGSLGEVHEIKVDVSEFDITRIMKDVQLQILGDDL